MAQLLRLYSLYWQAGTHKVDSVKLIQLKLNLPEIAQTWLDDISDNKGESEQKKIIHSILREVANQWQIPFMRIETDGFLETINGKIRKEDIQIVKIADEEEGELVLGDKITEKLQNAYAILKLMNPAVSSKSINDWLRALIVESIINKKAEQDRQEIEKEEKELLMKIDTEAEVK